MELVYFTLAGGLLYLGSDWLLNRMEEARGARFAHRSIVFFVIILCASMLVFSVLGRLTGEGEQTQTPPVAGAGGEQGGEGTGVSRK